MQALSRRVRAEQSSGALTPLCVKTLVRTAQVSTPKSHRLRARVSHHPVRGPGGCRAWPLTPACATPPTTGLASPPNAIRPDAPSIRRCTVAVTDTPTPHGGPCRAEQCPLGLPLPGPGPAPSGGLTTTSRRTGVREISQHQVASGQFGRAVNPADGVGSSKQGPQTHPAHADAWCITVPTGTSQAHS